MKLAQYLSETNLTLTSFAERVGVSQATVSRWCSPNGDRPRWPTLAKIESATNGAVTAADFMDPPSDAAA